MSAKVGEWTSPAYWITAAERTNAWGNQEFEIGIRCKETDEFWLCQGSWDHQSVQDVANAMAHLLSIPTENYDPEWCQRHFT